MHPAPACDFAPEIDRVEYGHWRNLDSDSLAPLNGAICDRIDGASSVLDVGCGAGVLLGRLQARGFAGAYLGIDHDGDAIAEGVARFGPSSFRRVGEREFFPRARFDALVLSEVLYYLPDPVGTLRRYLGFVRPGGKAVVTIYLRPGRPRIKTLLRSLFDRRFPRSGKHCAELVAAFVRGRPSAATDDIPVPGTSHHWRLWEIDCSHE